MNYNIHIDNQPERFLKKADNELKSRLVKKIKSLMDN